jgi:hypothetical protein
VKVIIYLPNGDVVCKTVSSIILVDNDLGNVVGGSSIAIIKGAGNHADLARRLASGN